MLRNFCDLIYPGHIVRNSQTIGNFLFLFFHHYYCLSKGRIHCLLFLTTGISFYLHKKTAIFRVFCYNIDASVIRMFSGTFLTY